METDFAEVAKHLLSIVAYLLIVLASICEWLVWTSDDPDIRLRRVTARLWEGVEDHPFLQLPQAVMRFVLLLERRLSPFAGRIRPSLLFKLAAAVPGTLGAWYVVGCFGSWWLASALIALTAASGILILRQIRRFPLTTSPLTDRTAVYFFVFSNWATGLTCMLVAYFAAVAHIETPSEQYIPMLGMLILFSIAGYSIFLLCHDLARQLEVTVARDGLASRALMLELAIAWSFTLTIMAFTIGDGLNRSDSASPTVQLLVSNAVFDGATVFATLWLLGLAVKTSRGHVLLLILALDILLCAVFAIGSLRIGTMEFNTNTEIVASMTAITTADRQPSIELPDCVRTLIARTPDGKNWRFGPYFWVMHTTFIPTLAYLTLILVSWVARSMLLVVGWASKSASASKSPLHWTAGLCGVLIAILSPWIVWLHTA